MILDNAFCAVLVTKLHLGGCWPDLEESLVVAVIQSIHTRLQLRHMSNHTANLRAVHYLLLEADAVQ